MISFDINNRKIHHIHLIGIGGISMSAIAEILLNWGYRVSGSDVKDSKLLDKLRSHGGEIFIGHHEDNIQNPDLIVYSAAIKKTNPERMKAAALNIAEMDRAEMLGKIMKQYGKAIAVAGSHGKTTTTSLISLLLEYSGLDPTILVGGELDEIGGNIKIGESPHFITEACEYVESFLRFAPFIGIILNVDEDHLDYYRDIHHIKEAFKKFAALIPENGFLIACQDDEHIEDIYRDLNCNIVTYSIERPADFMATAITFDPKGCATFKVLHKGEDFGEFHIGIPGKHNVYNALASIATAAVLGVDPEAIKKNIHRYRGIHRRFEILGNFNDITVVDDYAHHPVEIKATLEAAKQFPHKKIWAIFQPHTYSRTKAFLQDFANSFKDADHVIIADIYAAREPEDKEVSSKKLVELMDENLDAHYIGGIEDIVSYVYENASPGDLVLTMGAGDIYRVGESLLKKSKIIEE
ncbi:MAG: UDP-N-acetylmuramate--L-alanine ligase [Clostridiaceae bacterium]|nr:UDP-N-acetylmuramate--L-alanine ligase [Clostridiaceae bacterium]